MSEIIKSSRVLTKEQLLWDEKFQDSFGIGQSINYLKKTNPLLKFGLYVSDFTELTPADCVFLQLCRSNCDLLIVAIGTDYSMRLRKKNIKYSTQERIFRLGSLSCVNYIAAYDEEDCSLCVDSINSDIIFYGRTKNDKDKYKHLLNKDRLKEIEYPWINERMDGKFFEI